MYCILEAVLRRPAPVVACLVLASFFAARNTAAVVVPFPDPDPMDVWMDIMPTKSPNLLDNQNFRIPAGGLVTQEAVGTAQKVTPYSPWVWAEVDIVIFGGPDADLRSVDLRAVTLCHLVPSVIARGDWMSPPTAPNPETFRGEWAADGYEDLWLRVRKIDLWNECKSHVARDPKCGDRICFEFHGPIKGAPGAMIKGRDIVTIDGPAAPPQELTREPRALGPCYPNPFNPSTSFTISLERAGSFRVDVFNVNGQRVKAFEGHAEAGTTTLSWDGRNDRGEPVPSGLYLYRLQADDIVESRKMLFLK